jgi:endonuclease YncB( thermonuclease family)
MAGFGRAWTAQRRWQQGLRPRRRLSLRSVRDAAIWALIAAVLMVLYEFNGSLDVSRVWTRIAPPGPDTLAASFSYCAGGIRRNCVVDGDTFWFRGEKIRIADIDAPELSPPRCLHEAQLGEAAKRRLLRLLNEGPFSLSTGVRDADPYGRKLRTVSRHGTSLGDVLVGEGLARPWTGSRRSWCG